MALTGFKAQNHPQQTGKRGAKPDVDNLSTPPEVFDPLNERFGFTLDACALTNNAKLPRFFTPEQDGLSQPWTRERVWCNPPYSDIEPWLEKAWTEWRREREPDDELRRMVHVRPELIVMLLPANRTEQGWWQRQVEPYRDKGTIFRSEFLPGRLRFIKNGHDRVEPNQRPPFGCCLLIWDRS